MKFHKLKTWPVPFAAVKDGSKTHEIRLDDRNFKAGDHLILEEFIPDNGPRPGYTGAIVIVEVTYLTPGGNFGLPQNLCVMSIRKVAG